MAWGLGERTGLRAEDFELPPPFRARFPWYGGDLQTLRAYLVRRRRDLSAWPAKRLWLAMADGSGDRLAASLQAEKRIGAAPLVVLVHGLTGCEDSSYMLDSAGAFLEAGHPVLRLNLRGAGPSRQSCRQQYHAGRAEDLRDALNALDDLVMGALRRGLLLVGYSLGGNMLLKFLAEHGGDFPIRGAVAVSVPIDLAAAQRCLMSPRNGVYHSYMIRRMRNEALAAADDSLSAEERRSVAAVESVRDFDARFTVPRNGFRDVDDYYARCSALRYLTAIKPPTLIVTARNDPWIPIQSYLDFNWRLTPAVRPILPDSGGHVGFHGRGSPLRWHDRCALAFAKRVSGGRSDAA